MTNRIHEIDALRGFSLFGILLVNIFVFHAPYSYYTEFYSAFEGTQATTVEYVVNFAGGKFLFIFAFLFGYGIQLQRRSFTSDFSAFYLCKMVILFLIGAVHIFFFWFGDILASYALLGMFMLLLIRMPMKTLPILGVVLLMFSPLFHFGLALWGWPLVEIPKPLSLDDFITVFQDGSYVEILPVRLQEFKAFLPENLIWFIPKTLGLFLIGYWCAGIQLTQQLQKNKTSFLIGVVILLFSYCFWISIKLDFFGSFDLMENPLMRSPLIAINIFFEIALGSAYILGFLLLFQKFNQLSLFFGMVGRVALTNYIIQSLLCVFIFYGYGFGFYGKLRPTSLVIIAVLMYFFNILFSWVYLRYHRQGPLEFLWRKSTKILHNKYGRK